MKAKLRRLAPLPDHTEAIDGAEAGIERAVKRVFAKLGAAVARQVAARLKMGKAEQHGPPMPPGLMDALDLSLLDLMAGSAIADHLAAAGQNAGEGVLAMIGVNDKSDLVNQINERVLDFSRARAAELVGKKWVDGELVDNPNPVWAISETTRDMVRDTVARGIEEGKGIAALEEDIASSYAFSDERAAMIARTETIRAHNQGALTGYQVASEVGVAVQKEWLVGDGCCDICQENADEGAIDIDDDFPSGDDAPPAHPNCRCSISPVVADDSGDEEEA